jgi:hypothetical protein
MDNRSESIVLIGPSKAGKTTVGRLLGEALRLPFLDLDDLRWAYYAEIGYDHDKAQTIRQAGGLRALAAYWKPFDIYGVERLLADYPTGHVLAFGAGHSYYEDETQFARAQAALAPFPHVILLLPSPDAAESVELLKQRLREAEPEHAPAFVDLVGAINGDFIRHPSNARLAKTTLYTANRQPAETCQDILNLLNLSAR